MKIEIPLSKEIDVVKFAQILSSKFGVKLWQDGEGDKIHGYVGQIWILGEGKLIIELFEKNEEPTEICSYTKVKHPLSAKEIEDLKVEAEKMLQEL